MSSYNAFIRTNYFSVTDEPKLRELLGDALAGDEISVFEQEQKNGGKKFAFGLCGSISGLVIPEDSEPSMYAFERGLQKLVAPGDAVIITEIGYEKLRYLTAISTVITQKDICYVDIETVALENAKELLDDPEYFTQTGY